MQRSCFAPEYNDDLTLEWSICSGNVSVLEYVSSHRCPVNDREPARFDLVCAGWSRDKGALLNILAARGEAPTIDQFKFAIDHAAPRLLPVLVNVKPLRHARQQGDICLYYAIEKDRVEHLSEICSAFPVGALRSEHLLKALTARSYLCLAKMMATGVELNAEDQATLRAWASEVDLTHERGDFLVRLVSLGAIVSDEKLYRRTLSRDSHVLWTYLFQRDRRFHQWMTATEERFRVFQAIHISGLTAFGPRVMP
jgi:hypothetical protein